MLVEPGCTVLLVDARLPSQRGLAKALSEGGYTWEDIDAVLVSHLHGDHIHPSAVACCARHEVPILLHKENVRPFTRRILSRSALSGPVCTFDAKEFAVGAIGVGPLPVPHNLARVTWVFILS